MRRRDLPASESLIPIATSSWQWNESQKRKRNPHNTLLSPPATSHKYDNQHYSHAHLNGEGERDVGVDVVRLEKRSSKGHVAANASHITGHAPEAAAQHVAGSARLGRRMMSWKRRGIVGLLWRARVAYLSMELLIKWHTRVVLASQQAAAAAASDSKAEGWR